MKNGLGATFFQLCHLHVFDHCGTVPSPVVLVGPSEKPPLTFGVWRLGSNFGGLNFFSLLFYYPPGSQSPRVLARGNELGLEP